MTESKTAAKVVETKTREYLKYQFTEEELKSLAMEMAQATLQSNEAEEQKKAAMAGFKDTIEKHQLTARTASRFISNGYEMRQIDCVKVIDYKKDLVTVTRKDTGEEVESRKIKDSERQMTL